MSIIDVHTHPILFGEGQGEKAVRALATRARSFGIERLVALGDVLRYGRQPTARQIRILNDETAQVVAWEPKLFLGFCYLNPLLGARAVEREVERCLARGLRGLKLELANNARDACMTPVMRLAERHDLVVLQHTWSQTRIGERRFHSDPMDTVALARRFPSVRIIMAHLTGCGVRGILAAKGVGNLVLDTSGGAPEAGLVELAVQELGAERVLYGSDWPIRDFPVALARITGSSLSVGERRRILCDNARDWLRL